MANRVAPAVVIPDKAAFKASEVCELTEIQPYVLRTWETEFPELGVSRTPGGPRVYRKTDVEQVLEIKRLVLGEGLTLAGVRRRFENGGVTPTPVPRPSDEDRALLKEVIGPDLKARITRLKEGLRGILTMLAHDPPPAGEFALEAPAAPAAAASAGPARRSPRRKA
jgi:DNA-binding transcriptional MerR regulator